MKKERKMVNKVFVGCHQHGKFDYYCHGCLVASLGKLCDLIDEKEEGNER